MISQHEVVVPSRPLASKLILGAFVVGLLASMHPAPRTTKMFGDSRVEIAALTVEKLVYEAYPQWQHEHVGCPQSVYELSQFVDGVRALDPWGQRYRTFCTDGRLVVVSSGEDRTPNTTDDLWSNK